MEATTRDLTLQPNGVLGGGDRAGTPVRRIRRLLVANRGEIAARIIRTARRLGISTVAVYSQADSNSPFVSFADESVLLGPGPSSASYLNADRILEVALQRKVDALHPGYGFLSENTEFCKRCEQAGIIFIGPTSEAIAAMGSKIGAKRLLQSYDSAIPLIPGYQGDDQSDSRLVNEALRVGFPVLLKASAGGGGRGMRVVRRSSGETEEQVRKKLAEAIESARTEAQNAFGDGSLLIERYFDRVRHVEIQILGDSEGNIVHLFERECTVQRRHQKVIEEAPSPVLTAEIRAKMGEVAVRIGKAINYKSLGTVEFILDNETLDFFFLEVNTRLQVEHPVTEFITGLDLVEVQISVAEGKSLKDLGLASSSPSLAPVALNGHSIEARLYAEDPTNHFYPCTGTLLGWRQTSFPGVRFDTGVASGSEISVHYDPMISKVIVHAPTRAEAIERLVAALSSTVVLGLQTNKQFLKQVLRHPSFQKGEFDTGFIDQYLDHDERLKPVASALGNRQSVELVAIAAMLWSWRRRNAQRGVLKHLPSGWRNNPYQPQHQTIIISTPSNASGAKDLAVEVSLDYTVRNSRRDGSLEDMGVHSFEITARTALNSKEEASQYRASIHKWGEHPVPASQNTLHEWIELSLNGVRRQVEVAAEALNLGYPHSDSVFHLHVDEADGLEEYKVVCRSRFHNRNRDGQSGEGDEGDEKFTAPMPGKVLKQMAEEGASVQKGDPVLVMESMKMETKVLAHRAGVISFRAQPGDLVEENAALFLITDKKTN